MIRIDRPRGPSPYSPRILELGAAKLDAYFALEPDARHQRKSPVEDEWRAIRGVAIRAVRDYFRGKCAYCESVIDTVGTLDLDHFRPRSGATGLGGGGSLDHYCWLTLEWHNHFASCPACNRAKRTLFPVEGERAHYRGDVSAERALLIDPCAEDPADHLVFREDGLAEATTHKGETTIKVFNLNREPLVGARKRAFARTLTDVRAGIRQDPTALAEAGEPYVAVMAAALAQTRGLRSHRLSHLVPEEIRGADELIAEDPEAFRLSARALRMVEIENFKLIREMRLRFPEPGGGNAPWLMLLGENASGKSTVLQAIGLALAGAAEATRFMGPSKALTRGAHEGLVRLHFWDMERPSELRFRRGDHRFRGTERPSAIVLGYGALRYPGTRRTAPKAAKGFTRLEPLLRPVARIPHPSPWLAGLDDQEFAVAVRCLRDLLPIAEDGEVVRKGRSVAFRLGEDALTPLESLSAGYQTMIGVSADIMRLLFQRWSTLESAAGIVLIDEIDAHLHPRWKMRIVHSLREAFPQVQFIASTHDPLVLRGLRNGEVCVLSRDEAAGALVDQELPPIEGMPVDQILTSRHFGLASTLDPSDEAKLAELYHVQSLPKTEETAKRIRQLYDEIGSKVEFGRSRRERLLLQASDALLRETPEFAGDESQPLRHETVSRLQALIDRGARGPA